jgi:hypothetical protein
MLPGAHIPTGNWVDVITEAVVFKVVPFEVKEAAVIQPQCREETGR